MVTEGVVHGVYKVVTQSSFGVTRARQHKVSGGIGCFATSFCPMATEGELTLMIEVASR